ncbi:MULTISPECIES: RDD family protein [Bacillaceae]|uniref:RDD family protein n=1 Tax=Evansella alkalicola TaxID=745819 RepID=A0ABS6JUA9_9BACI|nr:MULTISPECIES: RDD family protein [Bacillaceae]MBU9721274.1 RDD family protein [Bacillus alkalicola]
MYDVDNPAGFWVRLGANIVDGLILFFPLGIISLIVSGHFFTDGFHFTDLLSTLYYIILPVVWYGYTLGKRAVGVRIARVDGEKVGLGTMLLRDIVGGLVYIITFGIGLIVSAFMVGLREDKRSIHDFIAGTYVTYNPPDVE